MSMSLSILKGPGINIFDIYYVSSCQLKEDKKENYLLDL